MTATFYLGTHQPGWLSRDDMRAVPLFVSARRLRRFKTPPRARGRYAIDSGGFSELSMYGEWRTTALAYAEEAIRWQREVGPMDLAAIQDWMCEPSILEKTGLTVRQHQMRTVASYRDLLGLAPEIPWLPVLQGWHKEDYLDHVRMYRAGGFDLRDCPLVGLGSVCRRQATGEVELLVERLRDMGIRLHAFGTKLQGLRRCARHLASADSMAWSYEARREPPMPGHGARHKNCANCPDWALRWRRRVLGALEESERKDGGYRQARLRFHEEGRPAAATATATETNGGGP